MSALYGLLNLDRAPVDRNLFEGMGSALERFGPDGGGNWYGEGVALGHCLLATTPEAGAERQPRSFVPLAVTAAGRLDNRADLVSELRLTAPGGEAVADGTIITEACLRWGDEAASRLFGDWAFAAWDPAKRRLLVARDQLGNTALHYHFDGRRFAFGTSRKALFALPDVPRRLNELRLAQHLAFWITDGAATLHEGILRLPPGHLLTVSAEGVAVSRYWHPERLAPVRLGSDEAYAERFLRLYSDAVATRLRSVGGVATTLSSGFDSSSVTALAAAESRRLGQRLLGFTARPQFPVDAGPSAIADEWPLAELTARHVGLADHRAVFARDVTPLDAMRRSLEAHDEPEFAVANLHWIHAILEGARDSGAGVLLTGQMGNGGISWSGDRQLLPRLLLAGRPFAAAAAVRAMAAARGLSASRTLRNHLLAPLRFLAAGRIARYRAPSAAPAGQGLINPAFADRIRIAGRMRESGYDPIPPRLQSPLEQRLAIMLPDINPVGALWHENGAMYGLDVRDPTADTRLLEFCLAIPDEQFRLGGQDRSLIRRAMRGLLPEAVLANRLIGRQALDFAARLHADAKAMDGAVDSIAASPTAREYLDVPRLVERWGRLRDDPARLPPLDAYAFGRSVQFGLFLSAEM